MNEEIIVKHNNCLSCCSRDWRRTQSCRSYTPAGCPAAVAVAPEAAAASAIFRSALAARLWKGISDAGGVSRYSLGPARVSGLRLRTRDGV